MSIKLMSKVWDMEIPTSKKIILLSLSDQANDDGVCWPSINTIMRRCGLSRRSVIDQLNWLEKSGILIKSSRENSSNIYKIILNDDVCKLLKNAGGVQELHGGGAGVARGGVQELHPNPNIEPSIKHNSHLSSVDDFCLESQKPDSTHKPNSKPKPDIPYEQIQESYNNHKSELMPQARLLTDSRKRAIKKVWDTKQKHQSMKFWDFFFKTLNKHQHWSGRATANTDRPWSADLDFALKNFVKVIEWGIANQ